MCKATSYCLAPSFPTAPIATRPACFKPVIRSAPCLFISMPQLYLEDVYEATGYFLAPDSQAALHSGGGRQRRGGGVVSQRDSALVQVRRTGAPKWRGSMLQMSTIRGTADLVRRDPPVGALSESLGTAGARAVSQTSGFQGPSGLAYMRNTPAWNQRCDVVHRRAGATTRGMPARSTAAMTPMRTQTTAPPPARTWRAWRRCLSRDLTCCSYSPPLSANVMRVHWEYKAPSCQNAAARLRCVPSARLPKMSISVCRRLPPHLLLRC